MENQILAKTKQIWLYYLQEMKVIDNLKMQDGGRLTYWILDGVGEEGSNRW